VELTVRDTGVGMTDEVKARAVEPFFTTKEGGQGSGLGLSMVHGLAKQLGGALRIDSKPGRGTAVSLFLPCATGMAAQPEEGGRGHFRPGARAGTGGQYSCSSTMCLGRDTVALTLRRLGYQVAEADGAGRGACRARSRRFRSNVLVSDIIMPGIHGVALADERASGARNCRCS